MNKVFYPAIFHAAKEGGFWVSFPDFPDALADGDEMSEAYEIASITLEKAIEKLKELKQRLPMPSSFDSINIRNDEYLVIVTYDSDKHDKFERNSIFHSLLK